MLRPTWVSASQPFSAVPASYAPTTRLLKSSTSTMFIRTSSASSSTGTSNSFMRYSLNSELAFAGVRQHDVARNFQQFAITARYGVEVVLNDALAALAEVFSQRFLDALEQVFIADAAFFSERRHVQKHAEKHDALHALLQVRQRGHFVCDLHRIQREHAGVFLNQVPSGPSGHGGPDLADYGFRTLDKNHSVFGQAGERILQVECVYVVERDEF